MAYLAYLVARLVEEFYGERTAAHACGVRLEDAEHLAYGIGGHAESGADAAADGVGRRDEGIGAVVDVEHRALGSFGKHLLALADGLAELYLGVCEGELAHVVDTLHPKLLLGRDVVVGIVEVAQHLFVTCLQRGIFLLEVLEDVAYAQARTAGLLAVGRPDAFARGAHLVLALGGLVGTVEHAVGGQDEVCATADVQPLPEVVAGGFQLAGFLHEEVGRDDAAVANDVELALVEDSAGNAAEHELLSLEDDGVSGVRTACKACNNVVPGCEHVHHLAFSFVAEDDAEQGIYFTFFHIL